MTSHEYHDVFKHQQLDSFILTKSRLKSVIRAPHYGPVWWKTSEWIQLRKTPVMRKAFPKWIKAIPLTLTFNAKTKDCRIYFCPQRFLPYPRGGHGEHFSILLHSAELSVAMKKIAWVVSGTNTMFGRIQQPMNGFIMANISHISWLQTWYTYRCPPDLQKSLLSENNGVNWYMTCDLRYLVYAFRAKFLRKFRSSYAKFIRT